MRSLLHIALLAPLCASAQAPSPSNGPEHHGKRFEIAFGAGVLPQQHVMMRVPVQWNQVIGNNAPTPQGHPGQFEWPTLLVQGSYGLCDHVSATFQYNHWQEEQWLNEGNDGVTHFYNSVNTYMAGGRYDWIGREHRVRLYSGAMFGASFRHLAGGGGPVADRIPVLSDTTYFAYQCTVLGIRYGGTTGLFAEYGRGHAGKLVFGLSVSF